MIENDGSGMDPVQVPDPSNLNDDENEIAEISEDVNAAPYPYEKGVGEQDAGGGPDADLG
jgi:hypothetical protein